MVGKEFRKARQNAGLSQEELAHRAGLHRTYISLLERSKKSPTLDAFFRICNALDISPAKLMKKIEDSHNEDS